jgi:KDO2-lipid IV(A) lauroyltransferase
MKIGFVHIVEYVLARVLCSLARVLPYRAALFLGWTVAALSFRVFRFRVKAAKQRLRHVFGDRFSEREICHIAWLSWRNFVFCVIDMIRLPSITMDWLKTHLAGLESAGETLRTHYSSGKGCVIACPHMGAWEMAGVALQVMKFPVFFLTGKQKNPLVDAYINRLRGSTGIDTVQRGSSMIKGVLRRLKDGHLLAFLPDVRMATEGLRVKFLGGEANVPAGMALFARQAGVPIFPAIVTRIGWSRHTARLCQPVWPDENIGKNEDWQRMTQKVFDVIDRAIREQPEQWFWFNKRWILDPL